jgi:glycosyltransferase 2 family protein
LPGLLVSLAALALVIALLDLKKFGQALLQADLRYLLAGSLVALLWLVVRGFFWRTLLQNKTSFKDSFYTVNEGYLLNNILPFRLGEIARALLMSRKSGMNFWQVVPSILIERALDLAFAVSLFLGTLPFVIGVNWARQAAIGIGVVVLLGLLMFYVLARNRQPVLAWVETLGERRPVVKKLAGRRVIAFFDGLAILTDGKLFLTALGWEVLNWLVSVLQFYLFLHAFFPAPTWLPVLFGLGVSALGIAAPSSPGAIGVYEAVLVGALSVFGLDVSIITAFALSMHIISYLETSLIGSYALYKDGESLSSLYMRLDKMEIEGVKPEGETLSGGSTEAEIAEAGIPGAGTNATDPHEGNVTEERASDGKT